MRNVRWTPLVVAFITGSVPLSAEAEKVEELAAAIRQIDPHVLSADEREAASTRIRDELRRGLNEANRKSSEDWYKIETREQWEAFVHPKIAALRKSLGHFPDPPQAPTIHVTGRIAGDGFVIENVLYQSRGLWVPANLYLPAKPTKPMPGIILCHSHHRPKEQGELQDMGMTWARAGCAVLVPELLGHGERRQHPFRTAEDYDGEFQVSRQDYYFRYDTGMQLHLAGESLIGWIAWDLMRGVDVLLSREGVDPKRIALLGAVAGGGDPCAVTAAIDPRITCAVPFNFGGPQPETRFPLPENSETSFNYAGSGGWESTRNLRLSARDGFLPWVIVGGIAPRRLIFAHEFNWDRERDPVWKRLNAIYGFYDAADHLAFTHGRGELKGRPPEATHCTNIGPFHRRLIHDAVNKWFDIDVQPEDEYSHRLPEQDLFCLTEQAIRDLNPPRLIDILKDLAQERMSVTRAAHARLAADKRLQRLRREWTEALGEVNPRSLKRGSGEDPSPLPGAKYSRFVVTFDDGIDVPVIALLPADSADLNDLPVVIGVAHSGIEGFLKHRSGQIAKLVAGGVAVILVDVRGTGQTRAGNDRGRYSAETGRSSTELMLGSTSVGSKLGDLRSLLQIIRSGGLQGKPSRIALWGESFAEVNERKTNFNVPRRVDGRPHQSEPIGGLLALLGALYENDIDAVYVHGGLAAYASVLEHQQILIPHDVVIPDVITSGDLSELAAALAPRPLRLDGIVDGLNRRLSDDDAQAVYSAAIEAYRRAESEDAIVINSPATSAAEWLIAALRTN